jgi:uncharacterized membrane protein YkoI
MTLSRLILTLALTATLASPALARHGDDDDDDDRRPHAHYSSDEDDDDRSHHGYRHADDDNDDDDDDRNHCTRAPRASWLSITAIDARARGTGFTVTKIERKGSCYEVYARKGGSRHELYFNPSTGKVVRWEDD